jgi:hypothetical protein
MHCSRYKEPERHQVAGTLSACYKISVRSHRCADPSSANEQFIDQLMYSMSGPRASNHNNHRQQSLRLLEAIRLQPEANLRRLALETIHSAHGTQPDIIDMALDNPYGFINNLRETLEPAQPPPSPSPPLPPPPPPPTPTSEPSSEEPVTPDWFSTEAFQSLPEDKRAELLSILDSIDLPPSPPRRDSADGAGPTTQTSARSSSSGPGQHAARERSVPEVLWPRIHEWLQSRTGPRPQVSCVWCHEELVVSEGDLQPEDGQREPAFQLPCSHIVGKICLRDSLEVHGVRITQCPFCRADIGDVYRYLEEGNQS